jgi:hypothetical protein
MREVLPTGFKLKAMFSFMRIRSALRNMITVASIKSFSINYLKVTIILFNVNVWLMKFNDLRLCKDSIAIDN